MTTTTLTPGTNNTQTSAPAAAPFTKSPSLLNYFSELFNELNLEELLAIISLILSIDLDGNNSPDVFVLLKFLKNMIIDDPKFKINSDEELLYELTKYKDNHVKMADVMAEILNSHLMLVICLTFTKFLWFLKNKLILINNKLKIQEKDRYVMKLNMIHHMFLVGVIYHMIFGKQEK